MIYPELLLLISCFMVVTSLWIAVDRRRKLSRLTAKHNRISQEFSIMEEHYQELKASLDNEKEFQKDLQKAEVTTKLQIPRIKYLEEGNDSTDAPERYKYIKELLAHDFDSNKLSSLLCISTREADQLIALSRIANSE
ncbi:MAG: hypothetical protein D6B25_16695 [Desulfobulbaceae bacterium]|nr:MAG: hypothetical protein D6B25_16695 [Desulfobulbaceae bacterium]